MQTLPQALKMAVENGADVINMSLGVVWHEAQPFPTTWDVAIHLATTSNVVLVAAAGNRGIKFANRDAPEIPAIHPDVISVAATTQSGARAPFSTSNRWVNIAAPGLLIYSTVSCSGASGCSGGDKDGTSMAAPMVSGVVAHMKARYPDATPAQIRQAMFSTALQPGSTQMGVRTDDFGWGIIQPHAAIVALGSAVDIDNAAPRFTSPSQRSVDENTTGAGAVTAVDEDDAVTGYVISGGSDQGLFTVNSAGALDFVSPVDFEAPTDADTDNIYEVAITATSGFGARALTAAQTIRVSVTDTVEPPGAPDPPTLEPATGSVSAVWHEPATTGPAINDYDLQYRAVDSPDEVLGTREWNEVGRDLWNVGCDIWRDLGGDGRQLWDDTWDDAGRAGRDVGDLIGDRLLRNTDAGTGWSHVWDTGCDIWRDLGATVWGPIWEVGEDLAEIGARDRRGPRGLVQITPERPAVALAGPSATSPRASATSSAASVMCSAASAMSSAASSASSATCQRSRNPTGRTGPTGPTPAQPPRPRSRGSPRAAPIRCACAPTTRKAQASGPSRQRPQRPSQAPIPRPDSPARPRSKFASLPSPSAPSPRLMQTPKTA